MKLDFRLPENRKEAFIRWFVWQLRTWDCDTPLAVLNYIFERQELNIEQRLYLSLLYGQTYQVATAYAIWNEIPDYENIDIPMITQFNTNHFKRLKYQTDTKWNKGYLDKMTISYLKMLNGKTQKEFIDSICVHQDPKQNYNDLNKILVENIYKMGRYCVWFYGQTLKICCNINIEPTSLLFGWDSESHTNGMCYAANREEWASKYYTNDGRTKTKREVIWTPNMMGYLQAKADNIIHEVKTRFPDVSPDYYNMETALCSFKKLFRRKQGRYLGYYHDRLLYDTENTTKEYPGVDFQIIHDFMKEKLPAFCTFKGNKIDNNKFNVFLDTGDLPELKYYEDLINV